eukprot:c47954_g1_i1 orf=77-271(-)
MCAHLHLHFALTLSPQKLPLNSYLSHHSLAFGNDTCFHSTSHLPLTNSLTHTHRCSLSDLVETS